MYIEEKQLRLKEKVPMDNKLKLFILFFSLFFVHFIHIFLYFHFNTRMTSFCINKFAFFTVLEMVEGARVQTNKKKVTKLLRAYNEFTTKNKRKNARFFFMKIDEVGFTLPHHQFTDL